MPIAIAVKVLETLPILNLVFIFTGTLFSRSEKPNPSAQTTVSFFAIVMDNPGISFARIVSNTKDLALLISDLNFSFLKTFWDSSIVRMAFD